MWEARGFGIARVDSSRPPNPLNPMRRNKSLEDPIKGPILLSEVGREDERERWEDSREWEMDEVQGMDDMDADVVHSDHPSSSRCLGEEVFCAGTIEG